MTFLKYFYLKTLKYDLANKFLYNNTKKIPKIEKVTLNFGCKTTDLKLLSGSLFAFELIAHQKGNLTTTKHSNILLKLRKGNPVGCKIILTQKKMLVFIEKIITEIFPKVKNFNGLMLNKKRNAFSFELNDIFSFTELEKHYFLFNNLPKMSLTVKAQSNFKQEFSFILKSMQFPIKT
jgi:large subunit ribosomal protein L5